MKSETVALDRLADTALRLALSLPGLMLAALVAALLLVAPARGQAMSCAGANLLPDLAAEKPELMRAMRAEAAQTPNGEGLLWRIEKDGIAPSHLFGTMHMSDARIVTLPEKARAAFDAAGQVVIETTDILEQNAMAAALVARPDLTMFAGGRTLADHLSGQERALVADALEARGVPLASVRKMKPWMLISLVAVPACETARQAAGRPVLDVALGREARARGLVETLALGERLDDVFETMIALYLEGKTGMIWPFIRAVAPQTQDAQSGYAAFDRALVRARNATMAERVAPILEAGGAFIAVGALHLPGEEGLVRLLREAGYAVERVD